MTRRNWNAIEKNPNIERIEFDSEVHALPLIRGGAGHHQDEDEKMSPAQNRRRLAEDTPYGITMVQADQFDGLPAPTGNIKICVVDTGYDEGHVDLPTTSSHGVDGFNPYNEGQWDVDGHGHGTHCAGTIGAIGGNNIGVTSVNPDPTEFSFYIGKGLSDSGSGSTSGVLAAAEACATAGAKIISMSLGGGSPSQNAADIYDNLFENEDVLIIAAAGNGGDSGLSYPASYDSIMSVAAVDSSGNKAGFSQWNEQVESKFSPATYTQLPLDGMAKIHNLIFFACLNSFLFFSSCRARSRCQVNPSKRLICFLVRNVSIPCIARYAFRFIIPMPD